MESRARGDLTSRKAGLFQRLDRLKRGGGSPPLSGEERVARFWSNAVRGSGCWLWLGGKFKNGYGMFNAGRFADGKQRTIQAHRFAFEVTHGPIPAGKVVMHSCDIKTCINPAHLVLATQKDNIHDAMRKGLFHRTRKATAALLIASLLTGCAPAYHSAQISFVATQAADVHSTQLGLRNGAGREANPLMPDSLAGMVTMKTAQAVLVLWIAEELADRNKRTVSTVLLTALSVAVGLIANNNYRIARGAR